ncbi:hypothetical protein ACFQUU_13720 [Herbaspirillum sp. GCM10030257]|uniref:hypothetical protein n=1 Tax=Herbaspirillum sp. GCM10030257 TaxID=3273393 RepID=UPI0036089677
MVELRISNELHRRATLLLDPSVAEQHLTQMLTESGLHAVAPERKLGNAQSNALPGEIIRPCGDFAHIGGIWLTVVNQGAQWKNPPPEPVDAAIGTQLAEYDQTATNNAAKATPMAVAADTSDDESLESGNRNVSDDKPKAGTPSSDISKPVYPPAPEPVSHGQRSRWRWRGRRRVLVP